jgi:photosystem II stability/assembly factor-like uncharacterized protein
MKISVDEGYSDKMKTQNVKALKLALLILFCLSSGIHLQAQWLEAKFPYGGEFFNILKNGNHLFAGNATHLYHSGDNGANWSVCRTLPVTKINCLTLRNNIVYTGTDAGLYKTEDNGQHWSSLRKNGLTDTSVKTLNFKGDTLIVGTHNGVFLSADNGAHWTSTNSFGYYHEVQSMAVVGNVIIIGVKNKGIYKSTDNGKKWARVDSVSVPSGLNIASMTVKEDTVYASDWEGIYRSTDIGESWEKIFSSPSPCTDVKVSDGILYVCCGNNIYSSADKGANWGSLTLYNRPTYYQITIDNKALIAVSSDGIFSNSSVSNYTWVTCNNGLTAKSLSGLMPWHDYILGTCWSPGGNFYLSPNGWSSISFSLDFLYSFFPVGTKGDTTFAISYMEKAYFVNTGLTAVWSRVNTTFTGQAICSTSNKVFIGGYGLYESGNNGKTWKMVSNSLIGSNTINSLVSSGTNIYAAIGGNVVYSNDNGATWQLPVKPTVGYIFSLFIHNNRIFAGTQSGVYYSDDGGAHWESSNALPSNIHINQFAAKDNIIFAACSTYGIFVSFNGGNSWQLITDDLMNTKCVTVAVLNDYVYVSPYNSSVWFRKITEIPNIIKKEYSASSIVLYPNPTTGIFQASGLTAHSTVCINNIVGEQVYFSVTNNSELQIDLSRLAKGVYFLNVMNKDGICENKKIVIQ